MAAETLAKAGAEAGAETRNPGYADEKAGWLSRAGQPFFSGTGRDPLNLGL